MEELKVYAASEDEALEKAKTAAGQDKNFDVLRVEKEGRFLCKKTVFILRENTRTTGDNSLAPTPSAHISLKVDINDEEGVTYVTVSATEGGPSLDKVLEALRDSKTPHRIEEKKIRDFLNKKLFGKKIPVAFKQDASAVLSIENNQMEAYITITRPYGGKTFTAADIKNLLAEKGIRYGIQEEMITGISSKLQFDTKLQVAEGRQPINGRDAIIDYKFDVNPSAMFQKALYKRVDFKETGLIQNVKKEAVLAVKTPANEGKPGTDILEKPLPAKPGKDRKIVPGRGVSLSKDGLTLKAETDGIPSLHGNTVSVEPILVLERIDYSTGNINFCGSLKISGGVQPGFKIAAKEHIEIFGVAEECEIKCSGSVHLLGGFIGKQEGRIECTTLNASYIEGGIIRADKSVSSNMILHANIYTHGAVNATGSKGTVAGGRIIAEDGLRCKELGSEFATATEVAVGKIRGFSDSQQRIAADIAATEKMLGETKKNIAYLKTRESITQSDRKNLQKFILRALHLNLKAGELREKTASGLPNKTKKYVFVEVENTLHPNVTVIINGSQHTFKDERSAVRIYEKKGEIIITGLT